MNKVSIIGVDLAKNVFQLHGMTKTGHACFEKQLTRAQLLKFLAKQPECIVAMEACCGAHYWAKEIEALGHQVKVIAPQYVKPYVQVHKNDIRDAQAIAEAASRPRTPEVAIKQDEQLDLQALHRIRERVVKERTAIGNELRGILAERGIIFPRGHRYIRTELYRILSEHSIQLGHYCRQLVFDLQQQWIERDESIQRYDKELEKLARGLKVCQKLQSIPGIGAINATLLYSYIGDVKQYRTARHLSAALGLVPRQSSSGGKEVLLGISKQGNKHVRKQLVHGARAAYKSLKNGHSDSHLSHWLKRMEGKHPNKIVVALANKLARIVWALLSYDTIYQA